MVNSYLKAKEDNDEIIDANDESLQYLQQFLNTSNKIQKNMRAIKKLQDKNFEMKLKET